ncbi:MAG: DUF1269 domain-containing protein, partial [Burkholderiaceae bacterium]
ATLASGLEGAILGGGASALFGVLTALGIPKDSVVRYETAIKADKFLVAVNGTPDEVTRARQMLASAGSADVQTHAGTV